MPKKHTDITLNEVQKILQSSSALKVVHSLIEKGLVSIYENLHENYKPKQESFVFFNPQYLQNDTLKTLLDQFEKKQHYQKIILCFLHLNQTKKAVSKKELLTQAEASPAQLKYLIGKAIFYEKKMDVDRVHFEQIKELKENILSAEQETVYQQIKLFFQKQHPVLLKGITGSGKTHVYFKLIEDTIANKQQALYLLPEIALTTQIIQKLRETFGSRVGIYHSRFSNQERVELWQKVQTQQFDVVVGSRSALLLPFAQLALIIVDEEHDFSYKQQDPAPRYHARDAAVFLAKKLKANILLGSATPSIESYYNTLQEKYAFVELNTRYGNATLPPIEIIDLKKELANKSIVSGMFSKKMIDEIQKSILNKNQVILFQNRRGYAPFVQCELCGWVPECKNCDVSLTYHKTSDSMHCHYCHSKSANVHICMACGSNQMKTKSFGTEKVEEEISKIFPNARVKRFDWDNLKIKNQYTHIIRQFEKKEIDILVGTQMVVKGLDFEHVDLVGVLGTDQILSYPHFRVNERAFQLIEQVAGRAGRKDVKGKVLVQLFNTTHPLLKFLLNHDYNGFVEEELKSRKDFLYPPFTKLIRIYLKHKNELIVKNAAQHLFERIKSLPRSVFFGPAEPDINRIKNLYIQEIWVKTNKEADHLIKLKIELMQQIRLLNVTSNYTSVHVTIDVDP
ncbi:MAG TPA: primosomal protein N' [Chitinophagaceae bacterium]|nr:primosomal protein N' [Chitinophagaceae bacterium]